MDWQTLLAYMTGSGDDQLLLRNEYLVEENRILRDQITGRVHLSDAQRTSLTEIGQKLGKKALEEVAHIIKPDTILGWHRRLAAEKFDGSKQQKSLGRPRVDKKLEDLVVQMAKENRSWGYDRIAGALAHLGYDISDQTVGNILKRRGSPERSRAPENHHLERIHPQPPGRAVGHRLLQHRSLDPGRVGDLLCLVLHQARHPGPPSQRHRLTQVA